MALAELAELHAELARQREQLAAPAAVAGGVGLVALRDVRAGEARARVHLALKGLSSSSDWSLQQSAGLRMHCVTLLLALPRTGSTTIHAPSTKGDSIFRLVCIRGYL